MKKKIPTLTEAQRKFARNLYARIYAYHENPTTRLSKKQREFFDNITERLSKPENYTPKQLQLIEKLIRQIKEPVTPNEVAYAQKLKQQLNDFDYARIAKNQEIEDYIGTAVKPKTEKGNYFTRVWNVDTVKDNEVHFRGTMLRNHFIQNPSGTYMYFLRQKASGQKATIIERKGKKVIKKKVTVTDELIENQLQKQIDETYANIVANAERQNLDNIHSFGLKKIQLSRDLTCLLYTSDAADEGLV